MQMSQSKHSNFSTSMRVIINISSQHSMTMKPSTLFYVTKRKNIRRMLDKQSNKRETHMLYHVDNTDDGIPGPEETWRVVGAARRRPRRVPARTAAAENSMISFVLSVDLDGERSTVRAARIFYSLDFGISFQFFLFFHSS